VQPRQVNTWAVFFFLVHFPPNEFPDASGGEGGAAARQVAEQTYAIARGRPQTEGTTTVGDSVAAAAAAAARWLGGGSRHSANRTAPEGTGAAPRRRAGGHCGDCGGGGGRWTTVAIRGMGKEGGSRHGRPQR